MTNEEIDWTAERRRNQRDTAVAAVCIGIIALILAALLSGCNNTNRLYDSEIAAIDRQTKILHKQNCILERIAAALENKGEAQ